MTVDLSRVRALCFDVDGTIADTDDHLVAQIAAVLDRVPLVSGRRAERVARQVVIGAETPVQAAYSMLDRLGLDVPFHRLRARLRAARKRGTDPGFLEHFKVRHHFAAVVGAQTTRRMKPFPDPLFHAAEAMGVAPHECLMIGDTTMDIRTGRAAGAQTIGVLCGFGTERELRDAGAQLILRTTSDLLAVLRPEKDPLHSETASPDPDAA